MKISKKQLIKIIAEERQKLEEAGYYDKLPKNHVDGSCWPGSLEDLAHEQTRSWGGGQVVDMPGFKSDLKRAKQLATSKDGSPLAGPPKRMFERITKRQLRRIVKETISQYGNDDRVENHPKRDELMDALHEKYGLMSRTTEEFGSSPGGVWINAESNVPESDDGLPLFDYYINSDPYMFGIHPDFEAFVIDNYGFAPEWNDPGTLMLWSID